MNKPHKSYIKKPISIQSNDQLLLFDCLQIKNNCPKLNYSVICKSFTGKISLCSAEPKIDKIIKQISGGEQTTINSKIENMLNNEKHGNHLHSHSMFPPENRPKVNPRKIQKISTYIKIIL
jgi:hypothetical protein